ncbi:TPA: hypothetical protein ACH3X1_014760 [Trebouxia sp. C0004]
MLRYSKRQNLVVFGIAESSACATPEALAAHVQSRLCTCAKPAVRGCTQLSSAPCQLRLPLGQVEGGQKKPRAVLVELTTVSVKHRAFKASSRLRASRIRLGLKVRGFKPFSRGTTLKYRDGGAVRQCAKGGANKIRAPAPTVPGPRPPTGTSIPMWQWILLRSYGRLVYQSTEDRF